MSEYVYATDEHKGHWLTGEEIVRCRDCRWLDHHNLYLCMLPDGDGGYSCWVVEPDGYCAWAERRTDE